VFKKTMAFLLMFILAITFSVKSGAQTIYDYIQPFQSYINIDDKNGNHRGWAGYGHTGKTQNFWSLRQWGNPSNLMPAAFPEGQPWEIANGNSRIKYYPLLNGAPNVYELAAAHVPCPTSGTATEANELDLFLEPKDYTPTRVYLSNMGQLQLNIGINFPYSNRTYNCAYNSSGIVASLILLNTEYPYQVFFLQINLGGTDGLSNQIAWCPDYEGVVDASHLNWNYVNLFCADDSVANYGNYSRLSAGSMRNFNLDVLPRIQQIIRNGHRKPLPFGTALNTNLKTWYLAGLYFGITNYGGTNIATQWWNPKIKASGGTFCAGTNRTQYICELPVAPNAGWVNVGGGCYHRISDVPC